MKKKKSPIISANMINYPKQIPFLKRIIRQKNSPILAWKALLSAEAIIISPTQKERVRVGACQPRSLTPCRPHRTKGHLQTTCRPRAEGLFAVEAVHQWPNRGQVNRGLNRDQQTAGSGDRESGSKRQIRFMCCEVQFMGASHTHIYIIKKLILRWHVRLLLL